MLQWGTKARLRIAPPWGSRRWTTNNKQAVRLKSNGRIKVDPTRSGPISIGQARRRRPVFRSVAWTRPQVPCLSSRGRGPRFQVPWRPELTCTNIWIENQKLEIGKPPEKAEPVPPAKLWPQTRRQYKMCGAILLRHHQSMIGCKNRMIRI